VERLETFLQKGHGDAKTLKGESINRRRTNITFISFDHECNCMKLGRFASACFYFIRNSTVFRFLLAGFGSLLDGLAKADRLVRRLFGF
jgi:hypothetical protein